jgi:hypothetical protein
MAAGNSPAPFLVCVLGPIQGDDAESASVLSRASASDKQIEVETLVSANNNNIIHLAKLSHNRVPLISNFLFLLASFMLMLDPSSNKFRSSSSLAQETSSDIVGILQVNTTYVAYNLKPPTNKCKATRVKR